MSLLLSIWKLLFSEFLSLKDIKSQLDRIEKTVNTILSDLTFTVATDLHVIVKGEVIDHMTLKDNQSVTFTLSATDAKGQPAALDGPKTTAVSGDAAIAAVAMNPDGLSGTITAGNVGSTSIHFTATDASDPSVVVSADFAVDVTGGPAANLIVTPGTPTP